YRSSYQQLKDLKLEIEHLQHLLEQARHRLTRDFEHWYVSVYLTTEDTSFDSNRQSPSPESRLSQTDFLENALPNKPPVSKTSSLYSSSYLTPSAAGAKAALEISQNFNQKSLTSVSNILRTYSESGSTIFASDTNSEHSSTFTSPKFKNDRITPYYQVPPISKSSNLSSSYSSLSTVHISDLDQSTQLQSKSYSPVNFSSIQPSQMEKYPNHSANNFGKEASTRGSIDVQKIFYLVNKFLFKTHPKNKETKDKEQHSCANSQ
ncbi:hypothetical protein HK096_005910, partial [Nowakowskiella sp. JEL0078]